MPRFPKAVITDEVGNVWHKEEQRQRRLTQGVEGAHLCIPFQCETCWHRNLEGRDPQRGASDVMLACIRRANLDAMAGKSPLTIRGHLLDTIMVLRNAERISKTPSFHPRGPFPLSDPVGMGLAIDMLLKSLTAKGRLTDYVQFSTIRKLRGTYSKNWESSPLGVLEGASFAKGVGRVRPTSCPSQSEWFFQSQRGMEYRMGSQAEPNHGLLIGAIVYVLSLIAEDAREAEGAGFTTDANDLWKVGAYVCILTSAFLRGHEGFYVELAGLRSHLAAGKDGRIPTGFEATKNMLLSEEICRNLPHVTIALLGHFKGETGVDHHLIAVASESQSGLKTRWWVEKLVSVCESEGRTHGPAFASSDGTLASSMDYDAMFRRYLKQTQEETRFIQGDVDVDSHFSTFRTLRKSATTRIERAGFGHEIVDRMNRWRSQEASQGRATKRRMNAHYAEAVLLMPTTWLGSYVL